MLQHCFIRDRSLFYLFDRVPNGFTDSHHARKVFLSHEVRAKIRRQAPAAEDQFGALEPLVEQLQRTGRKVSIRQETVIVSNRLFEHSPDRDVLASMLPGHVER